MTTPTQPQPTSLGPVLSQWSSLGQDHDKPLVKLVQDLHQGTSLADRVARQRFRRPKVRVSQPLNPAQP